MMFFVVDALEQGEALAFFPILENYLKQLRTHQGCQKAQTLELELDTSIS